MSSRSSSCRPRDEAKATRTTTTKSSRAERAAKHAQASRGVRAGPAGRGRHHRRQDAQGARARRRLRVEGRRRLQPRDDGEAPAGSSSFKPFVYAAAIDSGKFTPATHGQRRARGVRPVEAEELRVRQVRGPGAAAPRAREVDQHGRRSGVTVRHQARGDRRDRAQDGHRRASCPKEMSLALGSGEVTPLEMTNAIATLAAGGIDDAAALHRGDRRQAGAGARRASRCCGPRSRTS